MLATTVEALESFSASPATAWTCHPSTLAMAWAGRFSVTRVSPLESLEMRKSSSMNTLSNLQQGKKKSTLKARLTGSRFRATTHGCSAGQHRGFARGKNNDRTMPYRVPAQCIREGNQLCAGAHQPWPYGGSWICLVCSFRVAAVNLHKSQLG